MTYYLPDYTGVDPNYLRSNEPYTLFLSGQTIVFDVPIYTDSLVITTVGKKPTTLVLNTDYQFNTSDIDTTTMSRAKNADSGFSQTLARSVTINTVPATPQVLMSYQQFYSTTPTAPVSSTTGSIDLTPDLIIDLVRRVGVCEQQSALVLDSSGITSSYPKLLDFDIDGTNTANIITDETWTVNTFGNQKVIRPLQGSFFKDSVTITANGSVLTYGTDYLVLGVNNALTKLTANTSGIFDLILITKAYAGTVSVTYHAVGGEVTTTSVQSLYDNLYGLKNFLEASSFLTSDGLQDVSLIKQMQIALSKLEDNVRILMSGTNTKYGQTTNGTAISKSIRANDTQLHWWNIATLYQVSGSTDIAIKDRMSLHIELVGSGYMADVDVAFDMNSTAHPATITARNVVMDPGFTLFGDISSTTGIYPVMRIIWNKTTDNITGAILQIGLALPGLSDTLAIEDRSGVESAWLLDTTSGSIGTPLTPSDDAVLLPDQSSTWSSSGGISLQYSQTLQNSTGYALLATSTLFSEMDDSVGAAQTFSSNLPLYFKYQDIKELEVVTTDINGHVVITPVKMYPITNSTGIHGSAAISISSTKDLGVIDITVVEASDGNEFSVSTRIYGTTTIADSISLRYLIARI